METSFSSYSRICINCGADGGKILQPIGRVACKDGYMRVVWCNSGMTFSFVGNRMLITLGEAEYDAPVYVRITVDDTVYKFAVSTGKERLIIESLSDADHRVTIERTTEGLTPLLFKSIAFYGSKPSVRARRLPAIRRIEFIGDSLTCGYGVLADPTVSEFNTFEEDSTCAAAYLTGQMLKADTRTICLSGKGVVCNCNGDRTDRKAGDFFKWDDLDGTPHNFKSWRPHVLVINIGTNDAWGNAPEDEYIAAMRELALFARDVYPNAKIIWLCGMLGSQFYADALSKMIKELGGSKCGYYMLRFDGIENHPGEVGGGGHPNAKAHARFAKTLTAYLRTITGWTQKRDLLTKTALNSYGKSSKYYFDNDFDLADIEKLDELCETETLTEDN